jgi:hypothetical protein
MTLMIREPLFESAESASDPAAEPSVRQRAGLVFVPCALCHAPLDLSLVAAAGPRLCDHHLLFDGLPLQ